MATTVNSTAKDAGRPSCSEALPEGNTGALEPLGGLAGSGEDDDEVRDRDATTEVAVDMIGLTLLTCIHPRTMDRRFELVGSVEFGVL